MSRQASIGAVLVSIIVVSGSVFVALVIAKTAGMQVLSYLGLFAKRWNVDELTPLEVLSAALFLCIIAFLLCVLISYFLDLTRLPWATFFFVGMAGSFVGITLFTSVRIIGETPHLFAMLSRTQFLVSWLMLSVSTALGLLSPRIWGADGAGGPGEQL